MPGEPLLFLVLSMDNKKPFVTAAFFCEKVVIEKDDVATIIRIIDTVSLSADRPDDSAIPLTLFVAIKAGALKGKGEVSFVVHDPGSEKGRTLGPFPVLLNGDEHGAQFNVRVAVPAKLGLYWFDVVWNGERLTSVPLRLAESEE